MARTRLLTTAICAFFSLGSVFFSGAGCGEDPQPVETFAFPDGFLWGTSTAGFQVDMGCPNVSAEQCVDSHSDWYVWVTAEEIVNDPAAHVAGDPVDHGPGHYELYETDFALASGELQNNAFRMSLEWSRLFPEATVGADTAAEVAALADPVAVAHYHDVLTAARRAGLEVLVTLHHYTLPHWLHDAVGCHSDLESCALRGWLDRERIVAEFAKYARFAAQEYGDQIDLWATMNEPFAVVLSGYLFPSAERTNPPGVSLAFDAAKEVMAAMIEAHARAYDAIKENDLADGDGGPPAAWVGLVYNIVAVAAKNPDSTLDQQAAENVDYLYNRAFLNAVVHGELDIELDGNTQYRADLAGRMDYVGVNYYTRITVEGTEWAVFPELSPLSTFDPFTMTLWEDYPKGLYETVFTAHEYGKPVIVTECGKPDPLDDGTAPEFLLRHLVWLSRAIGDGADVRGFFYWSLMDNYEWNHGMGMKFGLYAVDPLDSQKTRQPRQAADVYARIAAENEIPRDLVDRYPEPW